AGTAQSLLYFRGVVFLPLFRSSRDGARLGGIRRRGAAARAADPGARENRHAAAAAALLHRPRSAANTSIDGAGGARRFGGSSEPPDQYDHRVVPRGRPHLLALLCRPAHGISDRAPGRGPRDGFAAEPVEVPFRVGRRRVFEAARLGPAPDVHPRGAGGRRTRLALGTARHDPVPLRAIRRTRPLDDTPGARRVQRGTARADSRQGTGAGLLPAPTPSHPPP